MPNLNIDLAPEDWQPIHGEPDLSYLMHYDFQCLGWDRDAHTIDFVLRFHPDGGHCPRHRHLAATTVIVVDGEQHLDELRPDGLQHKVRVKGQYHRSTGADEYPHMERGGAAGATVFYSCFAPDGNLFELLDDELNVSYVVTIDNMIAGWQAHLDEVEAAIATAH